MDPRTEAPTRRSERQVRISHLAHNADPEAVQVLLELAAQQVLAEEGELADVPASATELAHRIFETFEPEVPEFEVGEQVAREGHPIGKIKDRYIAERGDEWEYQVWSQRYGTNAYAERDLEAVAA